MTVLHWIVGILLLISALVMIVTVLLQSSERSGLGAISGAAETFFGKKNALSSGGCAEIQHPVSFLNGKGFRRRHRAGLLQIIKPRRIIGML